MNYFTDWLRHPNMSRQTLLHSNTPHGGPKAARGENEKTIVYGVCVFFFQISLTFSPP